jgi:hypothetical protein
MKLLAAVLALSCSLAQAEKPPLAVGTTAPASAVDPATIIQKTKALLNEDQLKTALADAEAAVAAGGGADALAARAEAKLALGRPLAEVIQDYAVAAQLDSKYADKYQGIVAQVRSETRPRRFKDGATGAGGVPMSFVGGLAGAGMFLLAISLLVMRRTDEPLTLL